MSEYLYVDERIHNNLELFQIIGGMFQATGWPPLVAIMGNWFSKSRCVCSMCREHTLYVLDVACGYNGELVQ